MALLLVKEYCQIGTLCFQKSDTGQIGQMYTVNSHSGETDNQRDLIICLGFHGKYPKFIYFFKECPYILSCFSRVQLFEIPLMEACQASLSMEILQAGILEWIAMPSSRGFSHPRIKPVSLMSPALAGWFFTTSAMWEAQR